jgi:hypothetical protein
MLDFRRWSFRSVVLASTLWIVLNVALAVAFVYVKLRTAGSGGIGAVGMGLVFPVLYLFGPPILLTLMWYALRRSEDGQPTP